MRVHVTIGHFQSENCFLLYAQGRSDTQRQDEEFEKEKTPWFALHGPAYFRWVFPFFFMYVHRRYLDS